MRETCQISAITFCFKRPNGHIYSLSPFSVPPCIIFCSYSSSIFIFPLSPFFLPLYYSHSSLLFFSSLLSLCSRLWCIGPDHSNFSQEEVIHWNSILVSWVCFPFFNQLPLYLVCRQVEQIYKHNQSVSINVLTSGSGKEFLQRQNLVSICFMAVADCFLCSCSGIRLFACLQNLNKLAIKAIFGS